MSLLIRKKILNASRKLTQRNVDDVKYLLKDDIGEGVLENIKNATELLEALEKHGYYSPRDLKGLLELLEIIGRNDIVIDLNGERNDKLEKGSDALKKTLKEHKSAGGYVSVGVIDIIANRIAGDWKRLARFCDTEESTIDQIDLDCRTIYERATKSLHTYFNQHQREVTWLELKEILKKLPRNDIIREVEKKCPEIIMTKQTSPEPQEESLSVNIPPEQPIGGNQQQIFFQDGQTEKEKEHLDPIAYAVSGSNLEPALVKQLENTKI